MNEKGIALRVVVVVDVVCFDASDVRCLILPIRILYEQAALLLYSLIVSAVKCTVLVKEYITMRRRMRIAAVVAVAVVVAVVVVLPVITIDSNRINIIATKQPTLAWTCSSESVRTFA
jgi:hypothetical protein